ncbi:MAG: hypothetical protein WAR77_15655 [Saprospiraceae bacterium]
MKTFVKLLNPFFAVAMVIFLFSNCSDTELTDLSKTVVDSERYNDNLNLFELRNKPIYSALGSNFKYLTLFDKNKQNGIAIKITTDDVQLLKSLNEETIEFFALDKAPDSGIKGENNSNTLTLQSRGIHQISLTVVEARIHKSIKFYGIKFRKTELIPGNSHYKFTYENTHVSKVHIMGQLSSKDASRINVLSLPCADCVQFYLAPKFSILTRMFSYESEIKTTLQLTVAHKFTDPIIVLW